jgi:dTDP-glucose pyrophosphorylase
MKPTIVIAAAGPPRPQVLTISSDIKSATMVPINGKPILGWMLDELLSQDFKSYIILTPENDAQIQSYVDGRYRPYNVDISLSEVEKPNQPLGVAHSLYKGLNSNIQTEDILIILGHTIFFNKKLTFDEDWLAYSHVDGEVTRWCFIETDEYDYVRKYIDKPKHRSLPDKALIGVYYIKNKLSFHQSLKSLIDNDVKIGGAYQISSALEEYGKMRAIGFDDWLDCGNITGIHKSKRKLIAARSFNSISVDEDIGILSKKSKNSSGFHQEFSWYVSLPTELTGLVPRVIEFKPCNNERKQAELLLEYYGYNSLEETWIYHNVSLDVWKSILKHLFSILKRFRAFTAVLSQEDYNSIYLHKTNDRIEKLKNMQSDIDWQSLLIYPNLIINKSKLLGIQAMEDPLHERITGLYNPIHSSIIHGDFHFANILYDINSRLVKLIDPRGNFGSSGIFGDCKYDFAKLRHSINGDYNYIVNDLFHIIQDRNKFDIKIEKNDVKDKLLEWFDNEVISEGFDIEDIKLIEGLLFLSMIPLHSDHPSRQLAIFARSIQLLNKVLDPYK